MAKHREPDQTEDRTEVLKAGEQAMKILAKRAGFSEKQINAAVAQAHGTVQAE